jgi:large subunit ribosomal protein L15
MATQEQSKTLTLGDLRPVKGATKTKLRVGRGRASGAGKTSNRGHNGEGQRSGRSQKRGFEGGQMPGYRKLPKINGFRLVNSKTWLELNLSQLDDVLGPDETELTYELLKQRGLLKAKHDGLRLLGGGELKRKLKIQAHYATASAQEKVKAAGGTLEILAIATEA